MPTAEVKHARQLIAKPMCAYDAPHGQICLKNYEIEEHNAIDFNLVAIKANLQFHGVFAEGCAEAVAGFKADRGIRCFFDSRVASATSRSAFSLAIV